MSKNTPPALTRETRDTLLILAAVAVVLLPQLAFLPVWASTLAGAMLTWRLWMAHQAHRLPSKWLLVALLALAVGATVLQFRSIVGPEAGAVLVVLLLVLKTLEMRARRDAMVIFFLGFFTLLMLLWQSQSLTIAIAMVLAVWALLTALVNAHMPAGYPSLRQLLCTSGKLMLWGAPVMLVLFLGFPRFAPLWGQPSQTAQGRTGLSDDMTVGQVAELAQSQSVVMRVRFDTPHGSAPPQQLLYFRGPVLSHFDGRHWKAQADNGLSLLPPGSAMPGHGRGSALDYEITLEPHQQRWLLTLDATLTPPRTHDLQWLSARPVTEVLRYQAQAHLHHAYALPLSATERTRALQLPQALNPRTTEWAQTLRTQHGDNDFAIIQAALSHLRTGPYTYTLQPGSVTSAHTADDFWFERQHGFCEHIASAFAVLVRAAGIPARIVTGYQGGERNPVDGLWTVRQRDAHAWTEVWLAEQGWVRMDPTAAIAPERIAQLHRLPMPSTLFDNTLGTVMGTDVLQQLRAHWEAINHRWNDGVLNYSSREQSNVLRHLGLWRWDTAKVALWLCAMAAAVMGVLGVQRWYRQRQPDPWLRLMQKARRQLTQAGIAHADQLGQRALAHAAQAQWGDESQPLQQWLLQMEQWRYAPHGPDTHSLATLRRNYRALTWPRYRTP